MMTGYMRSILIGFAAALLIAAGAVWYFSSNIKPYNAARDKAFIMKTFKDNWYWLLSDYSPDFDVEAMLDYRSPTGKKKGDVDKLILKTYVIHGKPVGFVHYYIDELKIGQILFMGVDEKYRRQGIARKLIKYAISDLKKRGMLVIRMYTRTDNIRARALYDSLGFKEIWTDGAYLIYELVL